MTSKSHRLKRIKKVGWFILLLFVMLNIIAFFHAYKFTHFSDATLQRTKDPAQMSAGDKVKTLLFGIDNPRPTNITTPEVPYEVVHLKSNKTIECWLIKVADSKGTVAIFHGYSGKKSSMLQQAKAFRELGYNTLLVDFMGSGNSEGDITTIGYYESEQVKTSFEYLKSLGETRIFLFGTSMGAVAIIKAVSESNINPTGIVVECPFGSMYKTVSARFEMMNAPSFPMAGLLVFWGGAQHGYWAFGHNPIDYAKKIKCPTLLLYGLQDRKVSLDDIKDIFNNLGGRKKLIIYDHVGHENIYLSKYSAQWRSDVQEFLSSDGNQNMRPTR